MHKGKTRTDKHFNHMQSMCFILFAFLFLPLCISLQESMGLSFLLLFFFPLFIRCKRLIVVEILSYDYEMTCNINVVKDDQKSGLRADRSIW